MNIGFISLGCAKNLVDSEVMLGKLITAQFTLTDDPGDADIIIINTCGFIDSAKEESISTILQLAEYKKSGKCLGLIVAGCLGQRYQQQLLDDLPEIDAIVGTGAWEQIIEAIAAVGAGQRICLMGPLTNIYDDTMPRIITTPSHSVYIKIAEGCSNCCSYCVIPAVRGPFRSRTIGSVVAEVRHLAAKGAKEFNLIAQDTTSYGTDIYGKPYLPQLLRELVKIDNVMWIRLLYCYPSYFSDELISLIANEPKICNYVDLPLQHAHDTILQAMHRHDRVAEIEQLLGRIRAAIPDVAIRTSFIVGFPGETQEHFDTLYDFVKQQQFDHVGVFIYSQEEDTVASNLPEQIPEEIKEERYHNLMALQSFLSEERNIQMEDKNFDLIIEGSTETEQGQLFFGRSYREAPDVDGKIYVENLVSATTGDFIKVKILQGFTYDLVGEKISS